MGKLRILRLVNNITGDFGDGETVECPLSLRHVVLEDVSRTNTAADSEVVVWSGHVQLPSHLELLTVTADEFDYPSSYFSLRELPKGLETLTFRPTQKVMFRGKSALESLPASESLKHLLIDHAEFAPYTPLMLSGTKLPPPLQQSRCVNWFWIARTSVAA
jgi:hypothetical protein